MSHRLLTREEVADLLRVSVNTVIRMQGRGDLPTLRLSRKCVRIPAEAVERHLDRSNTTRGRAGPQPGEGDKLCGYPNHHLQCEQHGH